MSQTETHPQSVANPGVTPLAPAELQRPDNFIGQVSHFVGNVAIPAASVNLDEAGHRYDAAETYSELPVEVGEFEAELQQELISIFSDKPYSRPVYFAVNPESGEMTLVDKSGGDPSLKAETYYSPEEIARIAELMQPTAGMMLEDFKEFKGQVIQPHSLVDEIAESEDIEFDEPRPELEASPVNMMIELRGGTYRDSDLQQKGKFTYHADGLKEGINTAYLGSFVEKGKEPLPTYIAPGLYPPGLNRDGTTPGYGHRGSEVLGVDNMALETAKIYRVSLINETRHSPPPKDDDPRTRVFMRAIAT
jgi:hypothetical protein